MDAADSSRNRDTSQTQVLDTKESFPALPGQVKMDTN